MKISSTQFSNKGPIPKKYTGEGDDVSPPLDFADIPSNAKTLALIVDDPDAPMGTFDHWIAWNIPATQTRLEENSRVPKQGTNHFRKQSYGGPMPPNGHGPHRYFFKLYALDIELNLPEGSTKEQLEEAMRPHILDKAETMGTYERK